MVHALLREAQSAQGVTVFDVGANNGMWSVRVNDQLQAVAPRARRHFVLVEPQQKMQRELRTFAASSQSDARIVQAVASWRRGNMTLHLHRNTTRVPRSVRLVQWHI